MKQQKERVEKILEMNDVRIVFRNFAGRGGTYNRDGDRNFAVVIEEEEVAKGLYDDGWNVKMKEPQEEGDSPFCFLTVKVKFNQENPGLNPKIYMRSGKKMVPLNEDTINILDDIEIESVDLDIRPYNYDVNGKTGVSAYLLSICVTQKVDRFMAKYAEEEYPQE